MKMSQFGFSLLQASQAVLLSLYYRSSTGADPRGGMGKFPPILNFPEKNFKFRKKIFLNMDSENIRLSDVLF